MWLMLLPLTLTADPAAEFDATVKPIIAANCLKCHGGDKPRAGLSLATSAGVLAGSKAGPVLAAGKPDVSLIVQVLAAGHDPHMPPDGQLAPADIDAIAKWVKGLPAAAVKPRKELQVTDQDRQFWSYRPVVPVTLPAAGHPIDALLRARQKELGLTPSPPADRRTLIRRLTFDLIGLPPTPEEIDAFLGDTSADAYEKLVDRLLASPRYGERWARHWLDLARYGDTESSDAAGPTRDAPPPSVYPYRDYVIRSLNADKPFDRFVMEQIAGDELAAGDRDARIATAFLRLGPPSGASGEKARLDDLDDALSTTASVFLGMTVGCARCHDHKTDPIPQRDYYRLLAVFAAVERRPLPIASDADAALAAKAAAAYETERVRIQAAIDQLEKDDTDHRDRDEVPAPEFVGPPSPSRWMRDRNRQLMKFRGELSNLRADEPRIPTALTTTDATATPAATFFLLRGDPRAIGDEVAPGVPTVLGGKLPVTPPIDNVPTSGRRLALARWIASPANPLTARVIVNRVWQHHFGRGIVATPSHFGPGGERPTQPELLDWLAGEFVRDGWRLKALHRLIVTSAAYRQSSDAAPAVKKKDPDNRTLFHFPRRRLDAESIRDAMLFTSGRLNPVMYGPGSLPRGAGPALAPEAARSPLAVREGPQQNRRSIYLAMSRQSPSVLLESFDAPPAACACDQRSQTTVPPQALLLLNGPFVLEQARELAARVKADVGDSTEKQIDALFRITLGRSPTEAERKRSMAFLSNPAVKAARRRPGDPGPLADLAHVIFNLNEFIYVD